MGQLYSRPTVKPNPSPPPSPTSDLATQIADAVEAMHTASPKEEMSPRPRGLRPDDADAVRENLWQGIIRAPGLGPLLDRLGGFLEFETLDGLLLRVAMHHGHEHRDDVRRRFGLRYADGRVLSRAETVRLAARMLRDEIDLSGFRPQAARERWDAEVVERFEDLQELENGVDVLHVILQRFIEDLGYEYLVNCLYDWMDDENTVQLDALLGDMVVVLEDGTRRVYRPDWTPDDTARTIAEWLLEDDEDQAIACRREYRARGGTGVPDWENVSDNSDFDRNHDFSRLPVAMSWATVLKALDRRPLNWRRVYMYILRHIDVHGLQSAIELFLRGRLHVVTEAWGEEGIDLMRRGRRRRPEAALAAVFADFLVEEESESRERAPAVRVRGLDEASSHTLSGDKDLSGGGDLGEDEDPCADLRDEVEMLRAENEELKEAGAADRAIIDMYEEGEFQSDGVADLEQQVDDLRQQLEDANRRQNVDRNYWPRRCPICTIQITDEEHERRHMGHHKFQMNQCREQHGLSPFEDEPLPEFAVVPPRRRPGRPRTRPKSPTPDPEAPQPPAKKRGRPPKKSKRPVSEPDEEPEDATRPPPKKQRKTAANQGAGRKRKPSEGGNEADDESPSLPAAKRRRRNTSRKAKRKRQSSEKPEGSEPDSPPPPPAKKKKTKRPSTAPRMSAPSAPLLGLGITIPSSGESSRRTSNRSSVTGARAPVQEPEPKGSRRDRRK